MNEASLHSLAGGLRAGHYQLETPPPGSQAADREAQGTPTGATESACGPEGIEADLSVRPLNDRIVLKRLANVHEDLIAWPDNAETGDYNAENVWGFRQKQIRCEVLAVGPGKRDPDDLTKRIPMELKPGDIVHIGRWDDYESDGLIICQEADVRFVEAHA